MPAFLDTPSGRRIAYEKTEGEGPGIVFLGGFMSDMAGSKAVAFEAWARAHNRAFLRFDYSGHGESSETFEAGCIGDWAEDALAVLDELTDGPQVLIGSSMGGWISLLMCKKRPEKLAALVTIAAAPDFTEDGFWADFDAAQRTELMDKGVVLVPSGYEEPYPITRRLIEDGRDNLVMREPVEINVPVRMVQGTDDGSVTRETALALLDHIQGEDVRLQFVTGADHSFSTPDCIDIVTSAIAEVTSRISTA